MGLISRKNYKTIGVLTREELSGVLSFPWDETIIVPYGNQQSDLAQSIQLLSNKIKKGDRLIVTSQPIVSNELSEFLLECQIRGINVIDFYRFLLLMDPSFTTILPGLSARLATEMKLVSHPRRIYLGFRQWFEPALGLAACGLLLPAFLVVGVAIWLADRGPVFYRQTRLGKNGRVFELIKFRSMRIDAESAGPMWASKTGDVSRLSPIGGFLRKTHLDELPQLWNVAKGELALIGPRPERPIFVEKIKKEIPLFGLRTLVKPGVTGWAQVNQGYVNSIDDSRRKLEYDLYYLVHQSASLDLKILLRTLLLVISGGTEGQMARQKRTRLAQSMKSSSARKEFETSQQKQSS